MFFVGGKMNQNSDFSSSYIPSFATKKEVGSAGQRVQIPNVSQTGELKDFRKFC